MNFKETSFGYILRPDLNEKIMEYLRQFSVEQNIKSASFSGIGALNNLELAYLNPETKKYDSKLFSSEYELLSFQGNISTKNGTPFIHAHVSLSDSKYNCIGGHLIEGIISATAEIFITTIDFEIKRKFDNNTNLYLWDI